jgi:hypothetical protein
MRPNPAFPNLGVRGSHYEAGQSICAGRCPRASRTVPGAPCGPFCGRQTSGWRTSFDCFEQAGQRLCLPRRALAAAPAPNSPPCQPCLMLSGTDPFTFSEKNDPADQMDCGAGADRHCQRGPSPCSIIRLRAKTNEKPQAPSNHAPSSNSNLRVDSFPARHQIAGLADVNTASDHLMPWTGLGLQLGASSTS